MEPNNWAPAHSEALREYWARGMFYSEIADAINAKFGTCYKPQRHHWPRQAHGAGTPDRPDHRAVAQPRRQQPTPVRERAEPVKLRCVGLSPRLVSLVDLENGECRYPYGGDKEGEAILFCGHPRLAGSSYCKPHFHLTRDSGCYPERAAGPVALRLVDAA